MTRNCEHVSTSGELSQEDGESIIYLSTFVAHFRIDIFQYIISGQQLDMVNNDKSGINIIDSDVQVTNFRPISFIPHDP